MEQINSYVQLIVEKVLDYAPKIGLALLVLFIGMKVINKLASLAVKAMQRAGVSGNILPFINSSRKLF